jgi:hypothetical protein
MLPLAPALLSTTKVVFRRDCSSSARTRAIVSPVPLPPGAGTMSWIVLPGCGQSWARAGAGDEKGEQREQCARGGVETSLSLKEEGVGRDLGTSPRPCAPPGKSVVRLDCAMDYVKLGRTGLDVSRLCLGCMSYGEPTAAPTSGPSARRRAGRC